MDIEIHRVAAVHGIVWFRSSLELAGKRPGALLAAFGWQFLLLFGVLLTLGVVLAGLSAVLHIGEGQENHPVPLVAVAGISVLVLMYMPVLYAGVLHVLREIGAGRPVRARAVFVPLAGRRVGALASLGLVQIAATALNVGIMHALGGAQFLREYVSFMLAAWQGQLIAEPVAEHALLMSLGQIVLGYFAWSAQVYAAALIQFKGARAWPAILASLRAASVNVLPLTLAGVLLTLGLIGGWIVSALLVMLVGMLLNTISSTLASAVTLALVFVLLAGTFALMFSGVLLSWRDMFAPEADASAPAAQANITAEL